MTKAGLPLSGGQELEKAWDINDTVSLDRALERGSALRILPEDEEFRGWHLLRYTATELEAGETLGGQTRHFVEQARTIVKKQEKRETTVTETVAPRAIEEITDAVRSIVTSIEQIQDVPENVRTAIHKRSSRGVFRELAGVR